MPQSIDFSTQLSAEHDAAEQKLIATRAVLLAELRAAGLTHVSIYYEGYDDDGNVDFVGLTPSHIAIPEDVYDSLKDWGWDFAYSYNPGFEIDCGGGGELEWDLQQDRIDLNYYDYGDEQGWPDEYKDQ